jgi:succinate dehydrogenase / fumarate reductase cytochrome b subunit
MVLSPPRPDGPAPGQPVAPATSSASGFVRPAGTVYRGREGMWSWVLHRITGIAIFFFLFDHVLGTSVTLVSPAAYNEVIDGYKNPVVGFLELGLVGAVVFHAFNGIRLILIDFWSQGPRLQRRMLWIVVAGFIVIMVPFSVIQLVHVLAD